MATFITSDSHFNHHNILEFEDRPFETVAEMETKMIQAWNDVVMKNDVVYYLGDFSFGTVVDWRRLLNELRGKIILIKGNHDKSKIVNTMITEGLIHEYHPLGTVIKQDKMMLNLSHYPMLIGARPRNFSIHGHIHSLDTGVSNHINVGVDSTLAKSIGKPFGTPIKMEELMERVQELNPLVEQEREEQHRREGRIK